MHDKTADSLLGRVSRAGRRFLAEVAVSAVATLCVTLALSGWFRQADAVQPPSPSGSGGAPPTAMAAYAAPANSDASADRPLPARAVALAPAVPVGPPSHARLHQPKPKAHDARPSCVGSCATRVVAASPRPVPVIQAMAEPQLAAPLAPPQAAAPLAAQRPEIGADTPLPPLPIPAVSRRPAPSMLGRVVGVSEMLAEFARNW